MSADHVPHRPSWNCKVDGEPWPCEVARERLVAEAAPTPLAVYMAMQMQDALRDLPPTLPEELFERFIGWTRAAPPYNNSSEHRYG